MSLLAARISVSNLHKSTPKLFSETVAKLRQFCHPGTGEPAPLVSAEVYDIVMKVGVRNGSAAGVFSTTLRPRLRLFFAKKKKSIVTDAQNKDVLDGAIVEERDFEYDYFGFKTLEKSYLLRCVVPD
ncbi:unnamed protein product [Discosporangium mesarthrocarpum]